MPTNPLTPLLRTIRQRFGLGCADSPDALLLQRFVSSKDEAAFAALVERHGALVWGICRRVAGADAEDAFQATWLVLVRKAGSLRDGVALPCWLHRVALRLALAAQARPAVPVVEIAAPTIVPEDEVADRETNAVIDEEVNRLPEKYRLPVLLCFFQGRTHAEAAVELGWPIGTVAGRLARAKDQLHARLTRRGLAPTVWPLPGLAVSAFPPVAGKAAAGVAVALAGALLAGETKRRLALVAAVLLLVCLGVIAGSRAWLASGMHELTPDRVEAGEPSPATRIPRTRIGAYGTVALSPDGKWVAGLRGGSVRLFDWRTNTLERTLVGEVRGRPFVLMFSPDGRRLAGLFDVDQGGKDLIKGAEPIIGPELIIWDLESNTVVRPSRGRLTSPIGFVSGGNELVTTPVFTNGRFEINATGLETHLWDARSGELRRTFKGGSGALSPDGKTLATKEDCVAPESGCVTRLWELSTGKELFTRGDLGAPIFCPDGETVACVLPRGSITYIDRKTGKSPRKAGEPPPDFAYTGLPRSCSVPTASSRPSGPGKVFQEFRWV